MFYRPLTQLLLLSFSPATSVPVPEVFEGVGSEHALRTASFCKIKSISGTSGIDNLKTIKGICRTLGISDLKVISKYTNQNTNFKIQSGNVKEYEHVCSTDILANGTKQTM